MTTRKAISLPNHEIVTLAVYLLGGERQRVDTEDIAVKANELASGRFTWRRYPGWSSRTLRRGVLGRSLDVVAVRQEIFSKLSSTQNRDLHQCISERLQTMRKILSS